MNINESIRSAIEYYKSGNLSSAEEICRKILKIQPDNYGLLNFLGVIYYQLKKYELAIKYFIKALRIAPASPDVHYNLGNVYKDKKEYGQAISCYKKAIQLNPKSFEALHNIGIIFQNKNEHDEAIVYFKKALEINPDLADAYYNLGTIFQDKEQWDEAVTYYRKALQLDPNFADAYYNLGDVYRGKRYLDEAIACFQRAIQLAPDLEDAYHNLGTAFQEKGMYDKALSYFQKALQLNPNLVDAKWNISLINLSYGNFSEGWKGYEFRWHLKDTSRRFFPQPVWDGSSLEEKRLLVYDEQGVGEEIMFASCLHDVLDQAASCIIETDKRLVPLFARSFPDATVIEKISEGDKFPEALHSVDVRVPIGSLPKFFRSNIADFPQRKAYLVPDASQTEMWHGRFRSLGKGLKVGISWRGGKRKDVQLTRSTSLEQWSSLFSIQGIHFINLQYGDCNMELNETKEKSGVNIYDWEDADPLRDLDNFASQVAALDLVISVDNATIHMAGALGVPVWTLLPYASDWRWMQRFEDTPWYPSMRLFRQNTFSDWDDVFSRAYRALKETVVTGYVDMEHWSATLENSYRDFF